MALKDKIIVKGPSHLHDPTVLFWTPFKAQGKASDFGTHDLNSRTVLRELLLAGDEIVNMTLWTVTHQARVVMMMLVVAIETTVLMTVIQTNQWALNT